ncbi:MAG: SCO family protein [Solirubrobacterales bacterium]|nr:SCO family protein [Solirubrobacterales bacterium]
MGLGECSLCWPDVAGDNAGRSDRTNYAQADRLGRDDEDADCECGCKQVGPWRGVRVARVARDVPVVAVSVDPANDTPASAKRFLAAQHLGGRMNFLLGSAQTLQPVWREFGIEPQKTGREHTATVVLLDAEGHQRIGFPVSELTPEGVAHDVRVLEREDAAQ